MLKCYAAAFLICFAVTLAVITLAALDAAKENREAGKMKPMMRRDKVLMLPKMMLVSALVSIPAPLTLLCYVVAAVCIFASVMRE